MAFLLIGPTWGLMSRALPSPPNSTLGALVWCSYCDYDLLTGSSARTPWVMFASLYCSSISICVLSFRPDSSSDTSLSVRPRCISWYLSSERIISLWSSYVCRLPYFVGSWPWLGASRWCSSCARLCSRLTCYDFP